MGIKVKQVKQNDEELDYISGYIMGCIQAKDDYQNGKINKNTKSNQDDYNKGLKDGYDNTYSKCQQNTKQDVDEVTELLKQEVFI